MSGHDEAAEAIVLPRSRFYHGPYGRMFRKLPPYVPEGENPIHSLLTLAENMDDANLTESNDPTSDNPEIPAGYTYFGQFIGHDITYDPTSSLIRFNDPNKLHNFRTPRLDLDSLYGSGPQDMPYLYDRNREGYLLVGKGQTEKEEDLPRNFQGWALIGDMRNDENIIISQLQLAFIKFHNAVMDWLAQERNLTGMRAFAEAQQLVRWHYQWVVIHDFLVKLVGDKIVRNILPSPERLGRFNLKYYDWKSQPFIPIEFSAAAFRFGHSMIRSQYRLNYKVSPRPIIPRRLDLGERRHLFGFRPLPAFWSLQWDLFLEIKGSSPQQSREIDTRQSHQLAKLPSPLPGQPGLGEVHYPNLASHDLIRGYRMELPSGQAVAKFMGFEPLEGPEEPLWHYILREAEELNNGRKLGPVGGYIVAEVIIGLVVGDPTAFLNVDSDWKPIFLSEGGQFELRDILRFAKVPLTKQELKDQAGFLDE